MMEFALEGLQIFPSEIISNDVVECPLEAQSKPSSRQVSSAHWRCLRAGPSSHFWAPFEINAANNDHVPWPYHHRRRGLSDHNVNMARRRNHHSKTIDSTTNGSFSDGDDIGKIRCRRS